MLAESGAFVLVAPGARRRTTVINKVRRLFFTMRRNFARTRRRCRARYTRRSFHFCLIGRTINFDENIAAIPSDLAILFLSFSLSLSLFLCLFFSHALVDCVTRRANDSWRFLYRHGGRF